MLVIFVMKYLFSYITLRVHRKLSRSSIKTIKHALQFATQFVLRVQCAFRHKLCTVIHESV